MNVVREMFVVFVVSVFAAGSTIDSSRMYADDSPIHCGGGVERESVCVCVCVSEKERKKERESKREREREGRGERV